MNVKITYYLDVVSSWCYWAEPAWVECHSLQVTQRPAFVLDDNIGDRAVFSGLVKVAPLAAAIDAMLDDAAAYASHAAHYGLPPPG